MSTELIFETNNPFNSVSYDKDGDSWHFLFENNIWITSSGFWRILIDGKIEIVSLDHKHQFGLSEPLDLEKQIRNLLSGKKLINIKVDDDTADLFLSLTNNIKIEIFISSTGYETHEFSINRKRYIGLGGGDIAIVDSI